MYLCTNIIGEQGKCVRPNYKNSKMWWELEKRKRSKSIRNLYLYSENKISQIKYKIQSVYQSLLILSSSRIALEKGIIVRSWNTDHLPCKWIVSSPDGKSIYKKLRQLTVSRGIVGIGRSMSNPRCRLNGAQLFAGVTGGTRFALVTRLAARTSSATLLVLLPSPLIFRGRLLPSCGALLSFYLPQGTDY
jgi:hypothetical protein